MKTIARWLLGTITVIGFSNALACDDDQKIIEIYKKTADRLPPLTGLEDKGWSIQVKNVDAAFVLEQKYSENLPNNREEAEKILNEIFYGPNGTKVADEFINAWQSHMDLRRSGIQKIPAIVIAKKYVVYGVLDPYVAMNKCIERVSSK